jgi:hypothetical protein
MEGGHFDLLEGSVLPFTSRTEDDYKSLSQDTRWPGQDLYQLPH